jgi:hypothetical protein
MVVASRADRQVQRLFQLGVRGRARSSQDSADAGQETRSRRPETVVGGVRVAAGGLRGFELGLEPIDGGGVPGVGGHRASDVSLADEMAEPATAEGRFGTLRNLFCFWVLFGPGCGFSPEDCAEAILIQGKDKFPREANMWNNKLCRRLFESRHDLVARAVLGASWAVCGILAFILWMTSLAQAALPQGVEKIEIRPKRETMNRERILGDRKFLSPGERERVLNEVQKRFNALVWSKNSNGLRWHNLRFPRFSSNRFR